MKFNFEKIKRSKFLSFTILSGSAFFLLNKIPFFNTSNNSQKTIKLKSNPLAVPRENSGDRNV